jgi:hypothetical protein
MVGGRDLSKAELVERLTRRSVRYPGVFNEGLLDKWIEKGLAISGDRRENQGLRPTYRYGYRHYRRALQLVRLYAAGVRDRDAVLVQLFLSGYSVKPHEVREPLLTEFRKAREKINAPIRSIYIDRKGAIPPGRKRQLLEQFGPPDSRLLRAEVTAGSPSRFG